MTVGRFLLSLAIWGFVLLLSVTPIGTMFGTLAAMVIAFSVIPIGETLGLIETRALMENPALPGHILIGIACLVTVYALIRSVGIWKIYHEGETELGLQKASDLVRLMAVSWFVAIGAMTGLSSIEFVELP